MYSASLREVDRQLRSVYLEDVAAVELDDMVDYQGCTVTLTWLLKKRVAQMHTGATLATGP